ncbi:MAG: PASTA domain-containing protein, partial [Clostridia bacterium]|nr:PASTA domain-containing protein [Clostridia bacterium]
DPSITVSQDIALELSRRLGVDEAMVLEKCAKEKRADETIKRQVEPELAQEIMAMAVQKGYDRMIYGADEAKRYYPYHSLASHIIGFCGTDGEGRYGVEAYYDALLTGENGKITSAQDVNGNDISSKYESYVDAVDGTSVMLTIDWSVQSILEKYVEEALEDTHAKNRVCGIVMDVNTAEILGMTTKPDFDLNDPYVLDAVSQALYDSYGTGEGEVVTQEQKDEYFRSLLYELWKNKAVTELYEPGSTFKIITSAMVLEENLVTASETFRCSGHIKVPGLDRPINCHKKSGHGTETFEQALANSCNPVYVIMSQRLGKDLFYKYYKAFGYTERTGVDILGETNNMFFELKTYSSVDVACAAFGENFMVTPISHLRAICAVANGGYLVTPHVLKASLDADGNVVESFSAETKRQVISTENCRVLWDYLYRSVEDGGNRNAAVQGYKVAAKTGTSTKPEPDEDGHNRYVGSCVAFAPADAPEVAVIFIVDEPVGNYYGSLVAAPYVSKILSEVLPYLGVDAKFTEEELYAMGAQVPDYTGRSLTFAISDAQGRGLNVETVGGGSSVVAQSPAFGTKIASGAKLVLYTEEGAVEKNVSVPKVVGLSPAAANAALVKAGLNIAIQNGADGSVAVKQSVPVGEHVLPGTVVTVEFRVTQGVTD